MATYVIGDVHGCLGTLEALYARLPFDAANDRLWMVGDLVNRGPDSAGVLRWARCRERELGERFVAVLGNHDVHLLARVDGADPRPRDTLDGVLGAPDRAELIDWLYGRPLLHREERHGPGPRRPASPVDRRRRRALRPRGRRTRSALPRAKRLLDRYAVPPRRWRSDFTRRRAARDRALAVFTLIRTIDRHGTPRGDFTGAPWEAPADALPWHEVPGRKSADHTIVFGHWAALGLRIAPGIRALDTGCVWGERADRPAARGRPGVPGGKRAPQPMTDSSRSQRSDALPRTWSVLGEGIDRGLHLGAQLYVSRTASRSPTPPSARPAAACR